LEFSNLCWFLDSLRAKLPSYCLNNFEVLIKESPILNSRNSQFPRILSHKFRPISAH
jgi:hypothetical protein